MNNTFGINIIPENDPQRIEVLKRYQILDTPPENAFDHIATLATQIFGVPISLISLVDAEQVYFKANVGMGKVKSSPRGMSLCSLAILQPEVTVFEDASLEPCLLANPLVAGDFGLRFYAGAPITTPDGFLIGTLCVIDKKTKSFTAHDQLILKGLASLVMDDIELRLAAIQENEELQSMNEELTATVEELAVTNEELRATNEELSKTQEYLRELMTNLAESRIDLQKSEDMLRISTEAAEIHTWQVDLRKGDFVSSPSLRNLLGYLPQEEMTFESMNAQIVTEHKQRVIDEFDLALKQTQTFDVEYMIIGHRDKKSHWLRAKGKLLHDSTNQPTHFSGVIIDITEKKLDELRKNDFIAMVSHELKTPLTSLKGYIQLLTVKNKKNEDAFTTNALVKGELQVHKMMSIIDGFLNVSEMDGGKIQLNKSVFNLNELINDTTKDTRLNTATHTITITNSLNITVNADQDKISQVINNFLSNAIKYSPAGKTIEIFCIKVFGNVHLGVKDQGAGIKKQDMEKLFSRFYRVDNHDAKTISGFGIGLYICAEIIQRHEGKIWVESEMGKGSTFYFSLPVYQ